MLSSNESRNQDIYSYLYSRSWFFYFVDSLSFISDGRNRNMSLGQRLIF
jgi:hypothetical protein